jgi:hypothetical protein
MSDSIAGKRPDEQAGISGIRSFLLPMPDGFEFAALIWHILPSHGIDHFLLFRRRLTIFTAQ